MKDIMFFMRARSIRYSFAPLVLIVILSAERTVKSTFRFIFPLIIHTLNTYKNGLTYKILIICRTVRYNHRSPRVYRQERLKGD